MNRSVAALLAAVLLLSASPAAAANGTVEVPVDSERWTLRGEEHRVEEHLGRPALFLRNADAVLEDVDFREGVLEFDVCLNGERGFSGAIFHRAADGEHEEFYLRPHQTGQPDACQYQPVYQRRAAWQLLHGPGFGATLDLPADRWLSVRIVVAGGSADVYVDSEEPVLFVEKLLRRRPGGAVGLFSGFAPAHFSRFRYREASGLELKGKPAERVPLPDGVVTEWKVSSAFAEESVRDAVRLPDVGDLTWSRLAVGPRGIANLAETRPQDGNTVFAAVTLEADEAVVAWMDFGFSDRVRVFLNGDVVFAGDDKYRSRDHRFLGTVGLFDAVPLRLRAGRNEVSFAVSKDFGGFGVTGRLRATEGVSVVAGGRE